MLLRLLAKLLLLSAVNGIALLALPRLAHQKAWNGFFVVAVVALVANVIYLRKRLVPAKYLFPATVFLCLFQLYPIAFTAQTAFTNYGTGNVLTKQQAAEQIVSQSQVSGGGGPTYGMALLRNDTGDIRLLLTDESGADFVASEESFARVGKGMQTTFVEGVITEVDGYKRLALREVISLGEAKVLGFVVKGPDGLIRPQSLSSAAGGINTFTYDQRREVLSDQTGAEYRPRGGNFVGSDGAVLSPGFRASVGWRNFTRSFSDAGLRSAVSRVFVWNYAFAILSVLFDSAFGLAIALLLNKRNLRGRRFVRSVMVLPYAMPSVMTMLIWSQGILNTGFGAVNRAIGSSIPWLEGPWLARLSLLVVNMWLGFGYKFLLFSGQLQSVPPELGEAAQMDGATPRQAFGRVTLPLLLSGLLPVLVSSFAFNFNNATLILALTGGGPPLPGSTSIAGQTDILMSYTYKVAFAGGRGQDYGYATALTILIFTMVAMISLVTFRMTKQFEEIR